MKYFFLAFVILVMVTGCKHLKQQPVASQNFSQEKTDSSSYIEKVRLVPYILQGSNAKAATRITTDNNCKFLPVDIKTKSGRASINIHLDKQGNLTGDCDCAEEKGEIAAKDTEIRQLQKERSQSEKVTVPETIKIQYTAWYDIVCRWLAAILLLLIIIYILIKRFL